MLSDESGRAVGLRIASDVVAGRKAYRQKGAYLLRTNCEETDPALLWHWYMQLIQAEAAIRTVKSDLGLRPIYHHKQASGHFIHLDQGGAGLITRAGYLGGVGAREKVQDDRGVAAAGG